MSIYHIAIFLITYLICSLNPAIEICKRKTGEDIRKVGSGNAGTANAIRVLGRILGTVVVILDISKVLISYFFITKLSQMLKQDMDTMCYSIFMVAAVIGHCFPVYYKFKGGKGVIVGITVGVLLNQQIAIVCIIAGTLVILVTRYVALGTISGLVLLIIMSLVMMNEYLIPILIVSTIILYKHRSSVYRLVTRQEKKFW